MQKVHKEPAFWGNKALETTTADLLQKHMQNVSTEDTMVFIARLQQYINRCEDINKGLYLNTKGMRKKALDVLLDGLESMDVLNNKEIQHLLDKRQQSKALMGSFSDLCRNLEIVKAAAKVAKKDYVESRFYDKAHKEFLLYIVTFYEIVTGENATRAKETVGGKGKERSEVIRISAFTAFIDDLVTVINNHISAEIPKTRFDNLLKDILHKAW